MRRALLVIDMLVDFVHFSGSLRVPDAEKILPRVKEEVDAARLRGDIVVFVCDAHALQDREFSRMGWPAHAVEGSAGAQVVKELAPRPGDRVVKKTTYSGFYRSELADTLEEHRIDSLRIAGCVTNICVLYTVADAAMRGYDVEVVEDAVAGLDPADHAFALRQMREVLGARLVSKGA